MTDTARAAKCSFCKQIRPKGHTIDFDEIYDAVWDRIGEDYDDAAANLPYDGAEGGYQGAPHYTTRDLIYDQIPLDLSEDTEEQVRTALVGDSPDAAWCQRAPFELSPLEQLDYSWDAFCRTVKRHRRFFFHKTQIDGVELLTPEDLLKRVSELAEDEGLFKVLPAGTVFFRARLQKDGEILDSALLLGPPEGRLAVSANRMNPPGIPIFYAADDSLTALREAHQGAGDYVVAKFVILKPVRVLDLSNSDAPLDYFETNSERYQGLRFLRHFAKAVAEPVSHDNKNHIDYIPTQVVAEYLRTQCRVGDDLVLGLTWKSSQGPKNATALFASPADLQLSHSEELELSEEEQDLRLGREGWLRLESIEVQHIPDTQ